MRTLRLPSVVSAVWGQVTVTVNPDNDPASEERLGGDAGPLGMTIGEPLPAFTVLFGSSTWLAPHSIPARALWYARTPSTSSCPLDCCIPVTERMNAPSRASTTSRKIAGTMLNPPWRETLNFGLRTISRHISHVHLLEKLYQVSATALLDLQGQAHHAFALRGAARHIGEAASDDVAREQRVVGSHRRSGLRSQDSVVPVTPQLACGWIADIGDRVVDHLEALPRRSKRELLRRRERDRGRDVARVGRAVVAAIRIRGGSAGSQVVDHDGLAAHKSRHRADHVERGDRSREVEDIARAGAVHLRPIAPATGALQVFQVIDTAHLGDADAVGKRGAQIARDAAQRGIRDVGHLGAPRSIGVPLHRPDDEYCNGRGDDRGDRDHDDHLDQRHAARALPWRWLEVRAGHWARSARGSRLEPRWCYCPAARSRSR